MKKAILSVAFIGLFTWFGLFGDEAPTSDGETQRAVVPKVPIEW